MVSTLKTIFILLVCITYSYGAPSPKSRRISKPFSRQNKVDINRVSYTISYCIKINIVYSGKAKVNSIKKYIFEKLLIMDKKYLNIFKNLYLHSF